MVGAFLAGDTGIEEIGARRPEKAISDESCTVLEGLEDIKRRLVERYYSVIDVANAKVKRRSHAASLGWGWH
jgi:hypothetical protein